MNETRFPLTRKTVTISALVLLAILILVIQESWLAPPSKRAPISNSLPAEPGNTNLPVSDSEQMVTQKNNRQTHIISRDTLHTEDPPSEKLTVHNENSVRVEEVDFSAPVPAETIIREITEIANYTDAELWSFSDLGAFYDRFLQLSTNSAAAQPDTPSSIVGKIVFSESNIWEKDQDQSKTVFAPDTAKIFAILPKMEGLREEVLVRWYATNNPELILFQKYTTPSNLDKNHIWLEYPQGWKTGTYKVEIYSEDEFVDLLAQGLYEVTE